MFTVLTTSSSRIRTFGQSILTWIFHPARRRCSAARRCVCWLVLCRDLFARGLSAFRAGRAPPDVSDVATHRHAVVSGCLRPTGRKLPETWAATCDSAPVRRSLAWCRARSVTIYRANGRNWTGAECPAIDGTPPQRAACGGDAVTCAGVTAAGGVRHHDHRRVGMGRWAHPTPRLFPLATHSLPVACRCCHVCLPSHPPPRTHARGSPDVQDETVGSHRRRGFWLWPVGGEAEGSSVPKVEVGLWNLG